MIWTQTKIITSIVTVGTMLLVADIWFDYKYNHPLYAEFVTCATFITLGVFMAKNISKHRKLSSDLETILDNIPALVFKKDDKNNLLKVNKYFADAHGLQKVDIEGKNAREFYPEDQAQAYLNDDTEVLSSGKAKMHYDEPWPVKEEIRWVNTSKIPVKTNGSTELICVSLDITTRKRIEEELSEYNRALEISYAELADKNEELDEFAFAASHDLQEPLRKITSFSEILVNSLGDKMDEDEKRYSRYIIDGTHRMSKMINDLLLLSRVSIEEIFDEQCDLNEIVQRALEHLDDKITEANLEVFIGELPVINGYKTRLVQLFANLLSNCVKYRSEIGTPSVEISAKKEGMWTIYVKDNGIGFDPKYQDQVFGVFKRLHSPKKYPGSGIGLAIAEKIVKQHGGEIHAMSELGKGSTFWFTLGDNR